MSPRQIAGTRHEPLMGRLAPALALGVLVTVLVTAAAGCGRKAEMSRDQVQEAPSAPLSKVSDEAGAPRSLAADREASGAVAPSAALAATVEAASPRREIIYTGEMSLEVDDVEAAAARIEQTALAAGGWLSARQLGIDAQGRRTSSITLRLPAARFAGVHDSLAKFGELIRDATQSRDVGMEFVDLEARLRNLEREEQVIAGLFSRGGKIGDVLQVERELARVRGEIEGIQGQLRYLRDQVGFSTLTVTLAPKRPAIERKIESWNVGYHVLRAWRALVALARMLTYAVIYGVVIGAPLALLAWGIWRIVRAARRGRPS